MFKKIVSNLTFSPALVGQLGFYAKRLRKEETTRRVGLIFTALALVVQFFAVFSPPQSANAASSNDMVYGGVSSVGDFLGHYDRNNANLKDIMSALGITRSEIANMQDGHWLGYHSSRGYKSWGHLPRFSAAQGEKAYSIPTQTGGSITMYARPTANYNSTRADIMVGHSAKVGWFAVMKNCGNLVTETYPPVQTCPPNTTGVYPNCVTPQCPAGQVGTYPNCATPKCPPGQIGTYPNCKNPPVPAAACSSLAIQKIADKKYQFTSRIQTANGATVSSYKYTIKDKSGKVIASPAVTSTDTTNVYVYNQSIPDTYSVSVTANTSVGSVSGPACASSFTIAAPAKCDYNPDLTKTDKDCQPCEGAPSLWYKDKNCEGKILKTKSAKNITQNNVDATTTTAQASDRITYTLTIENNGTASQETDLADNLGDALEYGTLLDNGGGELNTTTKELSWPKVTLKPGEKQSRSFTIQMQSKISAMAAGTSEATSYDCRMTNSFGNTVDINVDCPQEKVVEQTVGELPHTGPRENMIFAGIVFAIVAFFYARSRQMNKEVRLIRRDLNAGTI